MRRVIITVAGLLAAAVVLTGVLVAIWIDDVASRFVDFKVSMLASLAEDVLFFMIVGLGLAIVTLRHPKHDSLETKLRYFFPDSRPSLPFLDFARQEICRLAGLCAEAVQSIKVEEFDSSYNAYRVVFHYRYRLRNMFSTHDYEDVYQAFVMPDRPPPNVPAPKVLGQILELTFKPFEGHGTDYVIHPIDLVHADFDRDIPLRLPPHQEGEITFKFWLWCRLNEEHFVRAKRFVQDFSSTIENASEGAVLVSLDGKLENAVTVLPRQTLILAKLHNLKPRYFFSVWLHKPNDTV